MHKLPSKRGYQDHKRAKGRSLDPSCRAVLLRRDLVRLDPVCDGQYVQDLALLLVLQRFPGHIQLVMFLSAHWLRFVYIRFLN